jgi:hypothetical protein
MVDAEARPSEFRWTLRDWIAAVGLFAATAGVILWQNAHVAVFFDLSYMLNAGARIAAGQIPYRDFPLAQAPLTFVVQAAIIRLTGRVYFHHVLYVAAVGGLSTVLAWRIGLETLRRRIRSAWIVALLLAAPLVFLSVYSIMPNPEYDSDCAFWILVAVWGLQRIDSGRPTLAEPLFFRPGWGPHSPGAESVLWRWLPGIFTGAALCIPLFFKQNIGLPFLFVAVCSILFVLGATYVHREHAGETSEIRILLSLLAGVGGALLASALVLQLTAGLGNYLHWTITYAGQRRMPGIDLMLGIYGYPALEWMLPCVIAGLLLLRFSKGVHPSPSTTGKSRSTSLWLQIAAFLLLAAPFLFALVSLGLYYDDPDTRGDNLLMLWPALLILATALALLSLVRCWRKPSLRALLPLSLLAAINGAMMSQQLWGSTYGTWPLLVLLLAEMIVLLDGFALRSGATKWFIPATTALVSAALLICGGTYTVTEERLSYAQFPDGPPVHSTFPALAGMSTPGPFIPNLDELLRYAQANIPFKDGVMLMLGEDPFFFATGRPQPFPTTIWDQTCDPFSAAEIAAMARSRDIRWLIVKTAPQLNEDPTPDRAATLDLLMQEFKLAARLRGYEVYRAQPAS